MYSVCRSKAIGKGNSPKAKTKDRREAGKPLDPNDLDCKLNDVEGDGLHRRDGVGTPAKTSTG